MTYVLEQLIVHLHVAAGFFWFLWRFAVVWPESFRWSPGSLLGFSWLLFAGYWFVTALGAKKPSKQEEPRARLAYVAYMVVGFFLLYDPAPPLLGLLNRRFVSDAPAIPWLGGWLALGGVLFAVWARATIGRNWSAEVQIKQDHQLIRTGPYAHIRHPIYTGILMAVAGSALAIGEYRALLGLVVLGLGFARKAKKEERLLSAQFGPAFAEHQRHTGFFLPRFS
ncbi:MAG TPA: isoprenylcysteine carboxylmethyltransferase family protein [Candidatus Acidoferrales bacterium]